MREAEEKLDEMVDNLLKSNNFDTTILLNNKEYVKHLDDLKYGRVKRVLPKLLTLEEEAILRFYTTNAGYKNFNKALRGEIKMTDEFFAQERLMNQALNKLPNYNSKDILYRIENLTDDQIKSYYKVGEEVTNKHFTSCTYNIDAIAVAMRSRSYIVMIHIIGENGKKIEALSTLSKEKEI
ncbi:MAG: hypothetical protein ACK4FS_03505 [Flavobacterium sp.]